MAHPHTPVLVDESTGYHAPVEDASTQTACWNLLNTRDASTQTAEEAISQKTTQDASTQTQMDDLSVLEGPPATSKTSEDNRKRRICKVQVITHGPDVGKLPRTETCRMGEEFDSSLNIPPVYSGNMRNINTEKDVASDKTSSRKDKAPRQKSDADASKVMVVCSVDGILAIPGPSRCHENKSPSKSCLGDPQLDYPLQQQPSVQTEQKEPTCLACYGTISKHVKVHHFTERYECCRCPNLYSTFDYLQMHIYNEHTKRYKCEVCQMNYSEMYSHVSGGKCTACDKHFKCKYELEEHYISEHQDFLETKCTICKRKFHEHWTAGDVVRDEYQCCVTNCGSSFNSTSELIKHLCTHSPLKLFKCEVCGDHFKRLQKHLETVHPFCISCRKRFINKYFLNAHRSKEHKYEQLFIGN